MAKSMAKELLDGELQALQSITREADRRRALSTAEHDEPGGYPPGSMGEKMTKELTAGELQALQTVAEQAARGVASASSLEELLEQNAGELQALHTVTEQAARDVA